MSPDRFNKIVKNRANERVQAKIAKFTRTVAEAFKELHPSLAPDRGTMLWGVSDIARKPVKYIFRFLLRINSTDKAPAGFPPVLWEEEEAAVEKELLATLDEMAKALLAPEIKEPPPIAAQIDPSAENNSDFPEDGNPKPAPAEP